MDDDDAIAIVGIGCKFPGAENAEEYWNLLVEGRCEVKDIPNERFNVEAIYDENPNAVGKSYVRKAGLIARPFHWDRHLWGVSEKEASVMDPQQRYVLDCLHMAMQDGGLIKSDVDGTNTSVFIGAMNADYQSAATDDETLVSNYSVTGNSQSILSARVSYNYNLLGPSVTIDTACSSALVAIHLGSETIKTGESTMSICGGVSSILYPEMFITLSRARMASPTGQCQAFSANADGYARGEGCGIVILEKLSEAIAKQHKIWGTIQTGCNQDGRTMKPMTAPSGQQQTKLLEDIYQRHHIDPSFIQYIEAHGTGTPIGDPIEANSLGNFFKKYTSKASIHEDKRLIGSAKTNIGHLESAAGVAGIIKVLLMMKHGEVVPSLHAEKLNENIDFEGFQFQVPNKMYPWHAVGNQFRMACVNCFGFGGTNSHAVIKQNDIPQKEDYSKCNLQSTPQSIYIVAFSSQTINSLIKSIEHFERKQAKQAYTLKDISYTSLRKRDHLPCRLAIPATSHSDLLKKCSNAAENLRTKEPKTFSKYQICFVFCGVGTTWQGMCLEMISIPEFEKSLNEIDEHFSKLSGWSIKERILSKDENMTDPMFCHVAIFVCQVGLSKVWASFGITPDAIVGQSVGEVAAAYIAGYLSLSDAVKVIYFRSQLLAMAVGGQMMVIRNCKTEFVQSTCQSLTSGRANIAVYSSPVSCTVSGDAAAITELQTALERQDNSKPLFIRLDVACAYHSHHVEKAAMALEESLSGIKTQKPRVNVYSSVDGQLGLENDFASAKYWRSNVRSEVLFMQALSNVAIPKGMNVFVEIGPKPVLRAHLEDIFPDKSCIALASMKPSGEKNIFYQSLADMYTLGVDPKWENIAPKHGILVDIPRYQFDEEELRVESSFRLHKNKGTSKGHVRSVLIKKTQASDDKFNVTISPQDTPYIYNHKIDGAVVVPGAFYTEIAYELGIELFSVTADKLNISYEILSFVSISPGSLCKLDIDITSITNECICFSVKNKSKTVVIGQVNLIVSSEGITKCCPIQLFAKGCSSKFESIDIYPYLKRYGYDYEPPVQILIELRYNQFESFSYLRMNEDILNKIQDLTIHPAVLDGMFHPLLLLFLKQCKSPSTSKVYPVRFGSVVVRKRLEKSMYCYVRNLQENDNIVVANFLLVDENGDVIVEMKEVSFEVLDGSVALHTITHEVSWLPLQKEIQNSVEEFDKNQILVIVMRQKDFDYWQNVFPYATVLLLSYSIENNESWDSTLDLLKTHLRTAEYSNVVFISSEQKNEFEEDTYSQIRKSCHVLLAILQIFRSNAALIAVTENTQTVSGIEKTSHNFQGAAIWGYLRSARLETLHPIVLIDLQFQFEDAKQTVKDFLINTHTMIDSFRSDFVFTEKQIFYYNYLDHRKTKGLQMDFRVIEKDNSYPAEIRSRKGDAISEPFFIPMNKAETSKGLTMKIEVAAHLEVIPCGESVFRGFWPETSGTGYPILALEHIGIKTLSDESKMNSKKQKRYVACFPAKCCSQITFPLDCVCDINNLPFYKTGMVVPFVLAWAAVKEITASHLVYIVETEENTESIILREMLHQRKLKTVVLSPESFVNRPKEDKSVLVLLTNCLLEGVLINLQGVTDVIGLDPAVICKVNNALFAQNAQTIVNVVCVSDVFKRESIVKIFPFVRTFMEKHSNIMEIAMASLNASKIVFDEGHVGSDNNMKAKLHIQPKQIILRFASYIVVGGLTGLGWEVVKWLARAEAGQVIIFSRRQPDAESIEKMKNTAQMHKTKIVTLRCDVCDFNNVMSAIETIKEKTSFPIKGIYQGAGVLNDGYIKSMTREKIDAVLLPKVLGTLNIYKATRGLALDIFVLQSSIASVLGNPGQTSYSAANAFLDAFAHYCRSENRACQTINWGALDVGMVGTNATVKHQLKTMGHFPLNKILIKDCLTDALKFDNVQIVYASYDISKVGMTYQTQRVTEKHKSSQDKNDVFETIIFSEDTEEDRVKKYANIISISVANVLSIPRSEVEETQALVTLGLESQQATELIQYVYEKTGCKLPLAYVLSPDFSIRELAVFASSQKNVDESTSSIKILKRSISHYEKTFIDITQGKEESFFAIDIILRSSAPGETFWKTILQYVTNVTPEIRTFYKDDQQDFWYGIEKVLIEPEDIELDFHCHSDQSSENYQSLCSYKIEDSSIKFIFTHMEGSGRMLRVLFHSVVFDSKGISNFMVLFFNEANRILRMKSVPRTNDIPSPNAIDEIERYLESQSIHLKEHFVKQLMNVDTLVISGTDIPETSTKAHTSRIVPKALFQRLNANDTVYSQVMASLYALLLSKSFLKEHVPILVSWDIRDIFPELRDRIFHGTNYIPMIFRVACGIPLKEYIQESLELFRICTPFSIYPYELIKEIDGFKSRIFRHQFQARSLQMPVNARFEKFIDKAISKFPIHDMEEMSTSLTVSTYEEEQHMQLDLSFDESIVGVQKAEKLLADLEFLLSLYTTYLSVP